VLGEIETLIWINCLGMDEGGEMSAPLRVRPCPSCPTSRPSSERSPTDAVDQASVADPGSLEDVSAESFKRRLKGQRLGRARRHGKHLFIDLADGGALAMHFGTNGSLRLVPKGEAEPPYTRLQLVFADGDRLAYVNPRRLGRVSLPESMETFVAAGDLGPDVLASAFDSQAFAAILGASKRDVKSVLMDQTLMAGIGNIYSDEILFQARIFPGATARRLKGDDAKRLFDVMRKTLETAIERGAGSEQGQERLPAEFLLSQRHPGGHCPRCGAPLTTAKQGGRTGYYCRHCQKS
jgi:formamidopyrimidine-DNA glycosylase